MIDSSQTLEGHIGSCPVRKFDNSRGNGMQEINALKDTKKPSKPETGWKLSNYHGDSQEQ